MNKYKVTRQDIMTKENHTSIIEAKNRQDAISNYAWALTSEGITFTRLVSCEKINTSETGQSLAELALLLPVMAVVVIGAIAILSGDTTMLDLYNAIGDLFTTIGSWLGM